VRWGNVAFALAALVVAGGVIAAALDPAPPPRLPSDRAAPLIADGSRPRMAAEPAAQAKRPPRGRPVAGPARSREGAAPARSRRRQALSAAAARRAAAGRGTARRAAAQPPRRAQVVPPTVVPSAPVPSAPRPATSARDRGEFGFEGG